MKSTILVKLIPSNRDPGKTTAMRRCEGGNSFLTRPEEDSRPKQEYRPSRLSRLPGRSVKTIWLLSQSADVGAELPNLCSLCFTFLPS